MSWGNMFTDDGTFMGEVVADETSYDEPQSLLSAGGFKRGHASDDYGSSSQKRFHVDAGNGNESQGWTNDWSNMLYGEGSGAELTSWEQIEGGGRSGGRGVGGGGSRGGGGGGGRGGGGNRGGEGGGGWGGSKGSGTGFGSGGGGGGSQYGNSGGGGGGGSQFGNAGGWGGGGGKASGGGYGGGGGGGGSSQYGNSFGGGSQYGNSGGWGGGGGKASGGGYGGGGGGGGSQFGKGGGNFARSGSGGRGGGGGGGRGGGGGGRGGGGGGRGGGGGGGRGGGGGGGGRGGGGGGYRGGSNQDGGRGGRLDGGAARKHSLSLVEKFEIYCKFLRGDTCRVNSIQSIENACTATNMFLRCEYKCDELPRIFNRLIFTGTLSISGIFLARSVGCNKKDLKHEVYNRAMEVLKTKSIQEINDLKDCGIELVRASIERSLKKAGPACYQEGVCVPIYKAVIDIANDVASSIEPLTFLKDGLTKLIAYIKSTPNLPVNPISQIEQAVLASKCGLGHIYKTTEREDKKISVGEFYLEDTCIAKAENTMKKLCKQETYAKTLEALMNKQVIDLIVPVVEEEEDEETKNIHDDAVVAGIPVLDGEGVPPIVKSSLTNADSAEKWVSMMCSIGNYTFEDSNVTQIENCAIHNGLNIICLYRRSSTDPDCDICTSCELYIDNFLVGIGYGNSKSDCMVNAYNNGLMLFMTSTVPDIFQNNRKLDASELQAPTVLSYIIKGANPSYESNRTQLKNFGITPKECPTLSDFVLVEPGDFHHDRKTYAFAILQHSALCNGVLLEWTFTMAKGEKASVGYKHSSRPITKFSCNVKLGGHQLGDFTGYGKYKIRSVASWEGIATLYSTGNPVLKYVIKVDESKMIPTTVIMSEAEALRQKDGKERPNPLIIPRQPDEYVIRAVCNHIDSHFATDVPDDLVIGQGLVDQELSRIESYASSKKFVFQSVQVKGEKCISIRQWKDMKKIVDLLRGQPEGSTYVGYQLVNVEGVPDLLTRMDKSGPQHEGVVFVKPGLLK